MPTDTPTDCTTLAKALNLASPASMPRRRRGLNLTCGAAGGAVKALPLPREIPPLPSGPRLLLLGDMDAVSHGLAEGRGGSSRASNEQVAAVLEQVQSAARALGSTRCQVRWAASTATVKYHLNLVTNSPSNTWAFRYGLDGADRALLEELDGLAAGRAGVAGRKQAGRRADLIVLIAQDHIYAPAVRRLRLQGIPTWVLQPGRYIAAELYKSAIAVTRLTMPHAA
jgi:hypothetical protein